ncbi:MAG: ABC transporter ATP-binding protein [Desulfobacteraceae bacterium]|nr:ABC transporter ATP-binding protein [Desulfobacteraceae bacterium]
MRFDYGYTEEDHMGKPYDLALLKRMLPFLRPFKRLLIGSVLLVVAITVLELALPYFSKMAIDRFIVPEQGAGPALAQATDGNRGAKRYVPIDISNQDLRKIVDHYPRLFIRQGTKAYIALSDLDRLPKQVLPRLREKELNGLKLVVLVFFIVIALDFGLVFVQRMIMEYAGHKIMHNLRMHLFDHIQSQSMAFFDRQPVARLVTRVTNDIQNMHELFTTFVAMIFKDFFLLIGIAAALMVLNWRFALAGFAVLPIVVWTVIHFTAHLRHVYRALRVKVAQINSRMAESIDGIQTIQTFGREENNFQDFKNLNAENYRLGMKQIHIFAIFMPLVEVLGILATAILILYGARSVISGAVTLGALVAAITYLRMFFRPLRDLAENYNILQNAMASAERIFALLDKRQYLAPIDVIKRSPPALNRIDSIEFESVDFAYTQGEPVLRNVSIKIRSGRTLALVGPTGSGKTSLLGLLLRFYDPVKGRILINGQDLRGIKIKQLRQMTAWVPQDPVVFSGSLRRNIFENPDTVDQADVQRIIEAANCSHLVDRLPEGLDTPLEKAGTNLSTGERQLVTIARALAREPELVLLDEATSHIDSQTEAAIHEALANLMAGRTSILVAHRLSTARTADEIAVVKQGCIAETGTHSQLMELGGLYAKLTLQSSLGDLL